MHNNYYFLRQLTSKLNSKLVGFELESCFTQNKDELVFCFFKLEQEFFVKAHLSPSFCCLHFPKNFHRAKKNSVDLFTDLNGLKIKQVKQFLNERCFSIIFENNQELLFKMHGNRSNIILFSSERQIITLFNSHLKNDYKINIDVLDRSIDQSKESFIESQGDIKSLFPTFGKVVTKHLSDLNIENLSIEKQWDLISDTISVLNKPEYYIAEFNHQLILSLLPKSNAAFKIVDKPIDAINQFFIDYISTESIRKEKKIYVNHLQKTITQSKNYIKKAESKLKRLENSTAYNQIADIIMANLHQLKTGQKEATLPNFYNNNLPITIKLKHQYSPQKNAEDYYRKAKNQSKEVENLNTSITTKETKLIEAEDHFERISSIDDYKTLKNYIKEHQLDLKSEKQTSSLKPFNEFVYEGFTIYIGKNSKNNDKMIQSYTYKEDLWLHAKDVSGSHVIIKYQAGHNFPQSVIERAAQLAAHHSKRKTDSLCPVIVTPRKYVRKRKGDPAGAVVVDKEDVILVEPNSWQ